MIKLPQSGDFTNLSGQFRPFRDGFRLKAWFQWGRSEVVVIDPWLDEQQILVCSLLYQGNHRLDSAISGRDLGFSSTGNSGRPWKWIIGDTSDKNLWKSVFPCPTSRSCFAWACRHCSHSETLRVSLPGRTSVLMPSLAKTICFNTRFRTLPTRSSRLSRGDVPWLWMSRWDFSVDQLIIKYVGDGQMVADLLLDPPRPLSILSLVWSILHWY